MRKVLTVLLVSIFFVFFTGPVSAKFVSNQNNYNVSKDEIINDDLFVGGQTVEIDGTVNGDVFIGAQTVKISGVINGNLHVGTNVLDLEGTVKGNIYAGAQSILISNSNIGGSLLAGTATLTVDKDSTVGGSILAGAGTMSLDSTVGRSVYAGTGSLIIGANAKIGKDLYYAAGKQDGQVNISKEATVSGTIYKSEVNTSQKDVQVATKEVSAVFRALKFSSNVVSLIGALIVGFLYLRLFGEKNFKQMSNLVEKRFWKSLGVGFLVTIAAIPGLVILAFTVVGLPLAGLALLLILLYIYLAKIIVGACTGNWLSKRFNWKTSTYWAFALGLLVIYILRLIPLIGFLTGLVVLWVGLGAQTLKLFSQEK